jgi:outer membrane protein assembly factor BamB
VLALALAVAALFLAAEIAHDSVAAPPVLGVHSAVVSPAAASPQEWPTYLAANARVSSTTLANWLATSNASTLGVNWSFTTGAPIAASVTVSGGVAYYGSWDGYEYAANVATGKILWKTFLGVDTFDVGCGKAGITSAPTVGKGTLYLGGNNATGGADATWYALSTATGKILWSIPVGPMADGYYNWASPLVYNGFAYVGIASECDKPLVQAGLLQVNLTTHHTLFFHTTPFNITTGTYDIGASIWTSPSLNVDTNTIFVSTGNQQYNLSLAQEPYAEAIIALNATNITRNQTGGPGPEASWQIPAKYALLDGDFGAGPTVLRGVDVSLGSGSTDLVVAGDKDGYVYALNASSFSNWAVTSTKLGTLWALNLSLTQGQPITPAAFGGGYLYFGTAGVKLSGVAHPGSIWAVNPKNGKVLWNASLAGQDYGAPLYANGVVVVTGGDNLYAFNAVNGHMLGNWTYSSVFYSAPSVADGRIFEGDTNRVVYALCIPSISCTTTPQP